MTPGRGALGASVLIGVIAAGLPGCAAAPGAPTDEEVARLLAEGVRRRAIPRDRCSGDSVELGARRLLVPLNRDLALGCANLGWMLREWDRSLGGLPLSGVVAGADGDEICRLLRRERVSVTVLSLPEDGLPGWWRELRRLVIAEVSGDGSPGRAISGTNGEVVVERWRTLTGSSARDPAPHPDHSKYEEAS